MSIFSAGSPARKAKAAASSTRRKRGEIVVAMIEPYKGRGSGGMAENPGAFPARVTTDASIVTPNHLHGIIVIGNRVRAKPLLTDD